MPGGVGGRCIVYIILPWIFCIYVDVFNIVDNILEEDVLESILLLLIGMASYQTGVYPVIACPRG